MWEHHRFYRTRDAVIGLIRQHVSSEEVVGDFRLEELMYVNMTGQVNASIVMTNCRMFNVLIFLPIS